MALAVLITAAALAAVAFSVVRSNAETFRGVESNVQSVHVDDLRDTSNLLAATLSDYAAAHPADVSPAGLTEVLQGRYHLYFASVLDPTAEQPVSCDYFPCWADLPDTARNAADRRVRYTGAGKLAPGGPSRYATVTPLPGVGRGQLVLAAASPLDGGAPSSTHLWRRIMPVIACGLLASFPVGLAVAFSVRRPLRRITGVTRRFGEGDLAARVPEQRSGELAELGDAFNTMAERLTRTLDELHTAQTTQRRFVADVAHELRTPLSTMVATLDPLDQASPADQRRSAELLAVQTRRLAVLVDDLLEISRFDAGQADLRAEVIDLAALARDAVESVTPGSRTPITVTGSPLCIVDPRRIHTVIRNLISNAERHGIPPITVEIDSTDDHIALSVIDRGPGIHAQRAGEIFARFSRGGSARSAHSGGSGLGLAIARDNVTLHGGELSVSHSTPTRFTMRLPRRYGSSGVRVPASSLDPSLCDDLNMPTECGP